MRLFFNIIPKSNALAGDGATGWASGNQTCSGNIPAFIPKPIRKAINAKNARFDGSLISGTGLLNETEPPSSNVIIIPKKRASPPMMVIIRYL